MDERTYQKVNSLRKDGKLAEAWEISCPAVQENPNDQRLKSAVFWVCYAILKRVQGSIKSRAEGGNGDYTPKPDEMECINLLCDWIMWLDIPLDDYNYRSLFLIFQKNLECFPKLVLLLVKHSENLFTGEDKQPYKNENGESPSLMLKFSRKVAKSWMKHKELREISIDELCSLLARTRQETKDKQQRIWLDYDEAKCLILAKRYEQAKQHALAVLKKKQTESWAWSALAATYCEEDPDAAIVLFSKALCCAHNDVFSLPVLKGIAPLLAEQNFETEASMCVRRAVNCYVEKGWKIKADLEKLMSQPWYSADVDLKLLPLFLEEQSATALDFLFGEREQHTAVVQHIHTSGKGFHVYINRNQSVSVRLGLYRSKRPPSLGEYVRLTLSTEEQSVIAAEPCKSERMEDVGYTEGLLNINDKGFGFVGDTYVPKNLVQQNLDGQRVRVLQILDFDNAKSRYGWKALTIEAV